MLGCKAEVEANKREQKVEPAQVFIEQAPGEFGIPVIEGGEDHKHRSPVDDVVEMAHHKVGVVNVDIEGNLGEGNASDAAKHEIHDEGTGEQHR